MRKNGRSEVEIFYASQESPGEEKRGDSSYFNNSLIAWNLELFESVFSYFQGVPLLPFTGSLGNRTDNGYSESRNLPTEHSNEKLPPRFSD